MLHRLAVGVQQKNTVDNDSFNHLLGVILKLFSHCSIFYALLFSEKAAKNFAQKNLSPVPFARGARQRAPGDEVEFMCRRTIEEKNDTMAAKDRMAAIVL